jgi:hypothetical protein
VIWTEKKRSQKVFIRVKMIFLIDIIKILLWRTSDKDGINKELTESFNSTSSTMSKCLSIGNEDIGHYYSIVAYVSSYRKV